MTSPPEPTLSPGFPPKHPGLLERQKTLEAPRRRSQAEGHGTATDVKGTPGEVGVGPVKAQAPLGSTSTTTASTGRLQVGTSVTDNALEVFGHAQNVQVESVEATSYSVARDIINVTLNNHVPTTTIYPLDLRLASTSRRRGW